MRLKMFLWRVTVPGVVFPAEFPWTRGRRSSGSSCCCTSARRTRRTSRSSSSRAGTWARTAPGARCPPRPTLFRPLAVSTCLYSVIFYVSVIIVFPRFLSIVSSCVSYIPYFSVSMFPLFGFFQSSPLNFSFVCICLFLCLFLLILLSLLCFV